MNRSEGGSSLEDGQLELMVHRQVHRYHQIKKIFIEFHNLFFLPLSLIFITRQCLMDDYFGVGESLEEQAFGEGLVARGSHLLVRWEKKPEKNRWEESGEK